jgi:hypothetical protein
LFYIIDTHVTHLLTAIFKEIMNPNLILGFPGSGKSSELLKNIVKRPALYLVAFPRVDLMNEQASALETLAGQQGVSLPIRLVHSKGNRGSVERQLHDAAKDLAQEKHAVVMAAHEGLRVTDLTPFSGWHLAFDEIPDIVSSGCLPLSKWMNVMDEYILSPREDGFSDVTWAVGAPTASEARKDEFAKPLAPFCKAVRAHQKVIVDTHDWEETRRKGQEVRWLALWMPFNATPFASVTITGANFDTSLCGRVMQAASDENVAYNRQVIGTGVSRASPEIHIHYYTHGHTGSTTYWDTSEGRGCLNKVARHLMDIGGVGYWSGNEVVQTYLEHWFGGEMVSPKQAGSNAYLDKTSCAIIYSAKAQDGDAMLKEVFGWNDDDIRSARETEDIVQFVSRGSIRQATFAGRYDIYLYEHQQAEALKRHFLDSKITTNVMLHPVEEAGIMDVERGKSSGQASNKAKSKSPEEIKEGNRLRQEKSRAKKAAAQPPKRRGRPPISRPENCGSPTQP